MPNHKMCVSSLPCRMNTGPKKSPGAIWRTSLTPEGPGTLRVLPARDGAVLVTKGAVR